MRDVRVRVVGGWTTSQTDPFVCRQIAAVTVKFREKEQRMKDNQARVKQIEQQMTKLKTDVRRFVFPSLACPVAWLDCA